MTKCNGMGRIVKVKDKNKPRRSGVQKALELVFWCLFDDPSYLNFIPEPDSNGIYSI